MFMKQGTTLIGLVSLIMLATFGAAAYFVKSAYDAERGQAQLQTVLIETKDAVLDLREKVELLEKDRLAALDAVAGANAQADQLAARLREYETSLHAAQTDLRRATNQLATEATIQQSLNQKIAEMDAAKRAAEKQVADYRTQLETLSKQFPAGATTNATKENPFVGAYLALNLSPDEIRQRLAELEKLRAAQPVKPPSPAATANPPPAPAVAPGSVPAANVATGQIRALNAEFGFVILDVGAPQGVKVDDEFNIMRGAEKIGRLRVKRLYEGLSVCDILNDQTVAAFRIGDRVEQAKP